jgi:D-alanyl-D-alanine carboxypeptidase
LKSSPAVCDLFPSRHNACTKDHIALLTDLPKRQVLPVVLRSNFFRLAVATMSIVLTGLTTAQAQAPYLVVDASSGQVLLQDEATRPWNPASTTKMMTAFVALRAVKAGRAQMDSPLIASARAASQKPSKLGIRPGQEITLDNALKVMMVKSANDLAVVIAEAIGGSVEDFAQMMNAEARRLGMTESRFYNPHGFHAPGHQTSARDLAVLARALLTEFPEYSEYWGIGAVQVGNRILNNTNGLIGRYAGATGLKTGFVCASGFNLVSTATRGGRTLIVVVLGASSGGDRVVRSAQLLDEGFGSWGGQGFTLATLPRSGYSSAPDMRSQICSGRRRGVVLADDSDYGGAILSPSTGGDSMATNGSPLSFFSLPNAAPAQRSYAIGRSAGRAALGPRIGITPVAVYMGRAPGSTAVALGPGGRRVAPTAVASSPSQGTVPGIPASATALAPAQLRGAVPGLETRPDARPERPASQAAIRPGSAQPSRQPAARPDDEEAAGAPLQLPGVITNGPRPGAAAGIRPRQTATAPATPQRPAQAKATDTRRTAQAAPKVKADPKSAEAKSKVPPRAVPKKKQPAVDDDE